MITPSLLEMGIKHAIDLPEAYPIGEVKEETVKNAWASLNKKPFWGLDQKGFFEFKTIPIMA